MTQWIYQATLRPVGFATLPEDVAKTWNFVRNPGTTSGGPYGVISLPRALSADECDRFGMKCKAAVLRPLDSDEIARFVRVGGEPSSGSKYRPTLGNETFVVESVHWNKRTIGVVSHCNESDLWTAIIETSTGAVTRSADTREAAFEVVVAICIAEADGKAEAA